VLQNAPTFGRRVSLCPKKNGSKESCVEINIFFYSFFIKKNGMNGMNIDIPFIYKGKVHSVLPEKDGRWTEGGRNGR
jgi:hypothetical protein